MGRFSPVFYAILIHYFRALSLVIRALFASALSSDVITIGTSGPASPGSNILPCSREERLPLNLRNALESASYAGPLWHRVGVTRHLVNHAGKRA
jgi:hypothetical protein